MSADRTVRSDAQRAVLRLALPLAFSLPVPARVGSDSVSEAPRPSVSASAAADDVALRPERDASREPVRFILNAGQFDPAVRFQARAGNKTYWLTDEALWISVLEPAGTEHETGSARSVAPRARGVHLKLEIEGLDAAAMLKAGESQGENVNYLRGSDPTRWRKHVPHYGSVRWEGVRPGVDLQLSFTPERLGIVVARSREGGPARLRLRVAGADALGVDGCGQVVATTGIGPVSLPQVLSREGFLLQPRLAEGLVDFEASAKGEIDDAEEDGAGPLEAREVTAPRASLVFGTYLGKQADDGVSAVRVGADGSVYVTGTTSSHGFPTTPGAFDETYNSEEPGFSGDVFITKFDPEGRHLVYSTFIGGFDTDYGVDLAVGTGGEVYVLGYTYSNDFPTTPQSFSPVFNGGCCDIFVAKLDAAGSSLLYGTFLGGGSFEAGTGLAVDALGRAYVTGETLSTDFPTTPGAYDTTYDDPSYSEAFATVLSAAGDKLVFSTFLGGSFNDFGEGIAVGADRSVTVTGGTQSRDFPTTPGAYDRTFNGGNADAFVTRLDGKGETLSYSTYLGGLDNDSASGVVVDRAGGAYVTGHTVSSNFPTTPGASQPNCGSCAAFFSDAFVTRLRPAGDGLTYSTFLGGSETDFGASLALGPDQSVYVVGTTHSDDFPTTPDGMDTTLGGCCDAFVTHIGGGAARLYSTFLGGAGVPSGLSYDFGLGIDAPSPDILYVAGITGSRDFPTTPEAYDRTYAAGDDAFVAAIRLPPRP